ncbi:hypothetical protein WJX73_000776 [Symbiochloris irregularis]|uniref:RRM domain-containing protein n=1 Tax=Symbiochloris irregularis TaxID=706552 RepID=A0AAW1NZG8_9CHLO
MPSLSGLVAAVTSAVANGSVGSLSKLPVVLNSGVPPPIFSFWVCMGIVVSTLPVLLFVGQITFTAWGLVSGLLFVFSTANTFYSISKLGVSVATGVWSGVAVVASFAFGVLVNGDQISKPSVAGPGLALLITGLLGIAFSEQIAGKWNAYTSADQGGYNEIEAGLRSRRSTSDSEGGAGSGAMDRIKGFVSAVFTGLSGGLIIAPMTFAPEEAKGVPFAPSFAVGVLLAAPIFTAAIVLFGNLPRQLYARPAALPGIAGGTVWNIGNICSIVATQDESVGLSIAYPLMHSIDSEVQLRARAHGCSGLSLPSPPLGGSSKLLCWRMAFDQAGASGGAGPSGRQEVKLFLGGLSWETTEEKVRDYFGQFGEIADVTIMKDRLTDRPRGFGFLTYVDEAVAERVVQQAHTLDGRQIDAKRSVPQELRPRSKKIFVGGLAPDTTDAQFRGYFEAFGTISEAQIMQDHSSGRSRGFGFITYTDDAAVDRVFAAGQRHDLAGKRVEVKQATPRGSGPQGPRAGMLDQPPGPLRGGQPGAYMPMPQSALRSPTPYYGQSPGMAYPGPGMMAAGPYSAMGYQMPYYHPGMMVQQFAASPYGFGYGFPYGQATGQMQGQAQQQLPGPQAPFPPATPPSGAALPYDSAPQIPQGSGSSMAAPFGPGPGPGRGGLSSGSSSTHTRFPPGDRRSGMR